MLDFIGIGAQKAGTTWLYEWLRTHPEINFPEGKEIHFWDKHLQRGSDWYCNLFSSNGHALSGEITPAYATLPSDQIRDCYALFPDLRILYIIRNPIDRAWSAAKMDLRRADLQVENTPDAWFIENFNNHNSMIRGDYENCIRNWTSVYTHHDILILRFEELINHPAVFLNKCCEHIGASQIFHDDDLRLYAKVFEGYIDPMRPALCEYLTDLYREKIESISSYLDQDFSDWLPY